MFQNIFPAVLGNGLYVRCLAILKASLSSDDTKQALDRANEIENILLVALGKKIDKMLPFVPVEIQEKEKL